MILQLLLYVRFVSRMITIDTLQTKNSFRTLFHPRKHSPAIHCPLRGLGGAQSEVSPSPLRGFHEIDIDSEEEYMQL